MAAIELCDGLWISGKNLEKELSKHYLAHLPGVTEEYQKRITYLLIYLCTELSPSWEAANCAAIQDIPSNFKEPEGSSPCLQEPSTGPYPEPDRSSPR
jgi:hypothetical protein